ncbi:MAG: hypothetical protein RLZZ347_270 [Candidatus Parcubacteria bacterium]|jgi:hypothetical protein
MQNTKTERYWLKWGLIFLKGSFVLTVICFLNTSYNDFIPTYALPLIPGELTMGFISRFFGSQESWIIGPYSHTIVVLAVLIVALSEYFLFGALIGALIDLLHGKIENLPVSRRISSS